MKFQQFSVFLLFFTGFYAFSQQTQTGPIIQDYGAVWEIENPDFAMDKSQEFKVVLM